MISGTSLFFSCASSQAVAISRTRTSSEPRKPTLLPDQKPQEPPPPEEAPPEDNAPVTGKAAAAVAVQPAPERPEPAAAPERTTDPFVNQPLLGFGRLDAEKLADFLLKMNNDVDPEFVKNLSRFYVEEARLEGIDHDVAFAQMCLETGFLRYGGLVTADMNNFCGLGSTGPGHPGERFPSPQLGVRAQIQHLKGYATTDPLNLELVDPRYRYVRYGSAPTIEGLAGTWAVDRLYAGKIADILRRLYASAENSSAAAAVTTAGGGGSGE
jgi:hypothetical protein